MAETILIADDDPVQRRLLESMVSRLGYAAVTCDGGEAAMRILTAAGNEAPRIDCLVLDLVMPDLDGLGVLARMREGGLSVPVIVQTAHGGIDNVVTAMRAGAFDFVVKPAGAERLSVSLANALAARVLRSEIVRLQRVRSGSYSFDDLVTRNSRMRAILRNAEKAAGSAIPVLIDGESGVGKELVARAIHGASERRDGPFLAVNCGAIPDNLVESTLFGHEKGSFTGATERHVGKFAEASGGTLFLDEVGELPGAAQVKLLRAIQDGEIEPVGGRKPVKVDVRLISATNRDLAADVKSGRFREDLFYRLHVFPVRIPPLRERREDIPDLVRHFVARFSAEEGKRIHCVSAEAMDMLCAHGWPGNVRQLENAVFRAVVLADDAEIGRREFPQIDVQCRSDGSPSDGEEIPLTQAPPLHAGPLTIAPAHPERLAAGGLPLFDAAGDLKTLADLEKEVILLALARYGGRMSEVARRLGIGRSTLYRKLDNYGIGTAENLDEVAGVAVG